MSKPDAGFLTGPQRVAVLMLALGEEQGGKIVAQLHEDEIRDVSAAMAGLGTIRAEMVEALCEDFIAGVGKRGSLSGTYDSTERMLMSALPRERVQQIMEEIRGPAGRTMWDKLGNVNEILLANYLRNEYPQTVALVLSKIRPEHAARVFAALPADFALDVVQRMLSLESVQKEVLDGVERILRSEFMGNLARTAKVDPHQMMADIFNALDRGTEAKFMATLEERNTDAAERIKALMFTFDDLARLSTEAVQALLRDIPKDKLPIALKGASEPLRDLFFRNLSERAGKMLREDIAGLGPVRLRDVEEAQGAIVALAKDMAGSGAIELSSGGEDELVY